jgi:hypothetical protein
MDERLHLFEPRDINEGGLMRLELDVGALLEVDVADDDFGALL